MAGDQPDASSIAAPPPRERIDDGAYQSWISRCELPRVQDLLLRQAGLEKRGAPLISIIMPTYDTPELCLRAALESVLAQSYGRWQLCIVDDGSSAVHVRELLQEYAERDPRIVIKLRESNGGIAAASNDALALTTGDYIALMDHDDVLPSHALLAVLEGVLNNPLAALVYSDSDNIDATGKRYNPFFKPDWDYDLLLGQNYLNHLTVFEAGLLRELGGFRGGFEGSQDYDLLLRAVERLRPADIVHLPAVLYHWRVLEGSVSRTALGPAVRSARRAIREHLDRSKRRAVVAAAPDAPIFNRVLWAPPAPTRAVVVVHGGGAAFRARSTEQLCARTLHGVFAVQFLAANDSTAKAINAAAAETSSEVVLVLEAGWMPVAADWLEVLAGQAMRPEIGLVGAKMVLRDGAADGARLGGRAVLGRRVVDTYPCFAPPQDRGYFASRALDHQVSFIHGSCIALRRSLIDEIGGLNEALSGVDIVGADLCLRARHAGLGVIWCASVVFERVDDAPYKAFDHDNAKTEMNASRGTWQSATDPFLNGSLYEVVATVVPE